LSSLVKAPGSSEASKPCTQDVPEQPAPAGSSIPSSGKNLDQGDKQHDDLTQQHAKEALKPKAGLQGSVRDRFMQCDLVVPSVALNKFKQLSSAEFLMTKYVAILGKNKCRMYKTEKDRLCCMVMGDLISDPDDFWVHVSMQLKNNFIGGVVVFDNYEGDISQARSSKIINVFLKSSKYLKGVMLTANFHLEFNLLGSGKHAC